MSVIACSLPLPGPVSHPLRPVLAVGAFLKNTICMTKDDRAYVSVVHGDLGIPDSIAAFEASVAALQNELGISPVLVAHDLHPDFHSTRFAQALGLPCLAVQHHHAHAAAVAVEHGLMGPILGLCLDGFGLGPDRQSWGGELLWCDGPAFRRIGHLSLLPQPGGDRAAREPWRMAAAALHTLGRTADIAARWPDYPAAGLLGTILTKNLQCPPTSSAGRLFDAACGLLNLHPLADFEGQAPMALEAMVNNPRILPGGWQMADGVLDFSALLSHLADHPDPQAGADLFHGTLIDGLAHWVQWSAQETGCQRVVLGGGCFFNAILRSGLCSQLPRMGLQVFCPDKLSAGDPGVSAGQAWIAALHDAA